MPTKRAFKQADGAAPPWGETTSSSDAATWSNTQSSVGSVGSPADSAERPPASEHSVDSDNELPYWKDMEDIVISGVAGRFPDCDNVEELAEKLLNGVDLISEDDRRWPPGLYNLPKRHGKLKDLTKFDAQFFGIPPKQANYMDPQLRILLEVAYESILDAGINPASLRGSKTGVFVGCSASETASALTQDPDAIVGYTLSGCTRSMFANRLSFSFDLRGPSFAVDTACSSSLTALQLAVDSIRQQHCDAALVAGTHLTLSPNSALQFQNFGMLSEQGTSRSFDAAGDGYVRAETIACILLQKAPDAHRCYATVVHAKSNTDGFKEQGITFPSGEQQANLLRQVYREAGVEPSAVTYVETHGTGTKVGDPEEANALCQVFCGDDRRGPLQIGSVKSNMGHAEPASGIASLAKVIVAMERGFIPPNLYFNEPNANIPGLFDGRLKVISERTPWEGGWVGVNSFGFGGANTHVLLRSHPRVQSLNIPPPQFPRLLCYSGRTQAGVKHILDAAQQHVADPYFLSILAEQSNATASAAPFRGFAILSSDASVQPITDIQKVPTADRRPVWFVYSGMGSQWSGMGRDLMCLPLFKQSILQCSDVLRPLGFDPFSLIMKGDDGVYENAIHCMTCITAIQVALTDLLRACDVVPDGIVGHSTGEMACGYADGALSCEQTMKLAYHRGDAIVSSGLQGGDGAMAAVGLTWQQAVKRCPPGVTPACHNGSDSVTVSGDRTQIVEFIEQLKQEDIFAKFVNTGGVPFHSPAMQIVKERMLSSMRKEIDEPKRRSPRWLSTSVSDGDCELASTCSAEYQVNNAMSPVLFYDALKKLPDNAVVVELAPHGLLQAILRRTLAPTCAKTSLMKAHHDASAQFLLQSLGAIYEAGVPIDVANLYPPVPYPVPRGTPMIGPLVRWDHSQDWPVMNAKELSTRSAGGLAVSCSFTVDPFAPDSKDKYILDHIIDGRVLYPFTGHMVLAWRAFAKVNGTDMAKTPVVFEDVNVYQATIVNKQLKFDVVLLPGSGDFEILDGDSVLVSGKMSAADDSRRCFYDGLSAAPPLNTCERVELTTGDIYKEFLLRGYEYGAAFRGIERTCNSGDRGLLHWTGNWVTFLDALLQSALLYERADSLRLPVRLRYMRVEPSKQEAAVVNEDGQPLVHMRNDANTNGCLAGGVEVCDLTAQTVPRRMQTTGNAYLERIYFVKNVDLECLSEFPTQRNELSLYKDHCRALIAAGLQKWNHDNLSQMPNSIWLKEISKKLQHHPTSEWSKELSVAHSLGRMLEMSFTAVQNGDPISFAKQLMRLAEPFRATLHKDPLWVASYSQRPLKPTLDTALENFSGNDYRFCVIEPESADFLTTVRDMQQTHPRVTVEWSAVVTSAGQADVLGLEPLGVVAHVLELERGQTAKTDAARNFDVLLLERVLSHKADVERYLQHVQQLMRDDGFALIVETTAGFETALVVDTLLGRTAAAGGDGARTFGSYLDGASWRRVFEQAGLRVVYEQTDPSMLTSVFLVRRSSARPAEPSYVDVDDVQEFSWIEPLQQLIDDRLKEGEEKTIWLKNSRLNDNGTVGLGLCLRQESAKANRFRTLADVSLVSSQSLVDADDDVLATVHRHDLHANNYRDGHWGSFRHLVVRDEEVNSRKASTHAFINTLVRGDLSSLTWVESPNQYWELMPDRTKNQVLCAVYFAAVNFRDVMLATGRLPPDAIPGNFADRACLLGMEFSGRDSRTGRRLMGLLPAQALATTVVADMQFSWPVPSAWTLEQAATVPVVYTTAYYALVVRARIRPGERVLVHSGSGGVGQAAIAVALAAGCHVYTTVSSDEKKLFLQRRFPQLGDKQFSNSRTTEFEWHIRQATKGRGVDVVLNSLSEDKLQASLRCLAEHGRFCEIGKFDLSNNSSLGMALFLKNVTFHGILLDSLMQGGCDNADWVDVARLLDAGIRSGVVQPLAATVFSEQRVEEAFRFMAQGKHIGKVLVKVRDDEPAVVVPAPITVQAVRRSLCNPRNVYLITGGLGGFGLELAQWLIRRGARQLVLTSRSGIRTGYQARCIYFWRRSGVSVLVSTKNIGERRGAEELLAECLEMGPVGGVFHLAMVLRDCLFENQHVRNFKEAAAAKYWGTKHLDEVTRLQCGDELRWFVVFSSITSGRGNEGQTNYGWANSAMERIVERRRADGHVGVAIQWGAVGDVGVVAESIGDNNSVVGGTLPQRMPSCLAALDLFLCWDHPIVSSYVRADVGGKRDSAARGDILHVIGHILGVADVEQLDQDAKLSDMGLDSLMGVEIKQALERDHDVVLSMKDIRTLTLRKLVELAETGGHNDDVGGEAAADDAAQSEDDVEALQQQLTSLFKLRIDVNSLLATDKLVRMNDVVEGRPVFFVHSIEGISTPLRLLAQQLALPAYCFQCVPSVPCDSIESIAKCYLRVLREAQTDGPYRLVGYSYGACVAFEMATQLQQADAAAVEQLILLDGSHHYMQTYRKVYRRAFGVTEDNLANNPLFEAEVLCAFAIRFARIDYAALRTELLALAGWKERTERVVAEVMTTGLFKTTETLVWAIDALRAKFICADKYRPKSKFLGSPSLIKASQGAARQIDVGHDYGLGEVATGEVEVFVVDGDHDQIVQGFSSQHTAEIITEIVGDSITL